MTLSIDNASAIEACDAIVDNVDNGTTNAQGTLIIYDDGNSGASIPSLVDDALPGGAVVLAQLDMSNPAFGNAADATPGATATANAISDDTAADATGTAYFFRIVDRDNTPIIQGLVRASADPDNGEELVLNSKEIQTNARVEVTSLTVTMPEG